jgi:3-(3-hydroxy-phenyl)propionate hydroxylase
MQREIHPFHPPPELDGERGHYPVVIVGAGPVGLAAARDLALHGVRSAVLDEDHQVSVGSRAICWAKRTLEIFDRLGCAAPMMHKGVTWNMGKVFSGDRREPVYSFDLLADKNQCFPAFINLQQYYAETYLVDLVERSPFVDLRWRSRVTAVRQRADWVEVEVQTPHGPYTLTADYLIAADGSRSPVRGMLGLDFRGEAFQDHFLIADIRMQAQRPSERWFWFDPPFARGQSALLHKQPDDLWRLDFQLGWNIDRDAELDPARIADRVRRMLGAQVPFQLEWASIYTFQCRRLERFVHDRVIFAGDSAHLVSPFGARGANGGIQDIDNLCWKLALVLKGIAPTKLLESYDSERGSAAHENILNSTRSTDFITPKSAVSRAFRDATLELARENAFARRLVNSGRLSVPAHFATSALNAPGGDELQGILRPGSPAIDAPCQKSGEPVWFLRELQGVFTCVVFDPPMPGIDFGLPVEVNLLYVGADSLIDLHGKLAADSGATPGSCLVFRPDQHLLGCWREFDVRTVRNAVLHCIRGGTNA